MQSLLILHLVMESFLDGIAVHRPKVTESNINYFQVSWLFKFSFSSISRSGVRGGLK